MGWVISIRSKSKRVHVHAVGYLHCKFTFYNYSYLHFCEKLTIMMVFLILHYTFKTHLCPFIYKTVLSSYKPIYLNMDEPVKF